MNSALMTQAEYATHRGVGPSAVSNYKAKGLLVWAEGPAGKLLVDVVRTDAKLNGMLDPTRGRPTAQQAAGAQVPLQPPAQGRANGGELGEVRADLLREQRTGHKIRNARDAGELVALAEYERRTAELGRMARERMHVVVRDLAERLAAAKDARTVTSLLTEAIDRTFAELADQVDDGALAPAEDDLEAEAAALEAAQGATDDDTDAETPVP